MASGGEMRGDAASRGVRLEGLGSGQCIGSVAASFGGIQAALSNGEAARQQQYD